MIEPFLSFSSFSHLISLPDCRHVTRGPGVKWESESIGSKAGPVWKVWLKKKQALIIQSLSMTLGDTVYCPSQVTTTLHSTQHYTPPHPTTTPPHASTHHYTTSTRLHTPIHHLDTPPHLLAGISYTHIQYAQKCVQATAFNIELCYMLIHCNLQVI